MNPMAGAKRAEHVHSSCLQITAAHSQWSQRDPEHSRHLAAQTVFLDITETLGTTFVPDLFAALERTPAYLETAWELFKDAVDLEVLDAQTKHIVALAITTNRSGTYQIAAFPHAFRLSPVGSRRCETILSLIEMFQAFSRYLSDAVLVRHETNELGPGFA
ncbi:MAG: hypothetical protein AB7P24_16865 [Nitrospira sp.]|nr:hypothetical protein [bacterium]